MNYTTYKIKSKIKIITEMVTDIFFDIVFFIPRYFYEKSPKFRTYIENNQNKSHIKSRLKKLSANLFKKLEKNNKVLVLNAYDVLNDSFCDLADRNYGTLLEDERWTKKNKLVVEKHLVKDYAAIFYKNKFEDESMCRYYINDYKDDNNTMYVVTKLKPTF